MQRGKQQASKYDHQSPQPGNELVFHQIELGLQRLEILLGRDIVVNRIEPPGYVSDGHAVLSPGVGGDMLRGVTADAPLLDGLREGEPIRHWARSKVAQFG